MVPAAISPGCHPTPGSTRSRYDDELSVDRGELYFEAGLRMENIPEITFGYTHRWRNGQKDSTMLGRSNAAGSPPATNRTDPLYDIDETTDTFDLDITHTLGNTDLGLGLRYSMVRQQQHPQPRQEERSEPRSVSQRCLRITTCSAASMFSETRFNERMMLSFGYLFTTMDTDTDGHVHRTLRLGWHTGTGRTTLYPHPERRQPISTRT